MLARTPEEAIERLKILMSQSDMTVESVTEQLAANGR